MATLTTIDSFRAMIKVLKDMHPEDPENIHMLDVPPDIKAMFEEIVKEATPEEIVQLCCILCNTGAADWDFIAHMFL